MSPPSLVFCLVLGFLKENELQKNNEADDVSGLFKVSDFCLHRASSGESLYALYLISNSWIVFFWCEGKKIYVVDQSKTCLSFVNYTQSKANTCMVRLLIFYFLFLS